MKKTAAIFSKQLKDTFKNKEVLIQFLMFPVMAVIMENAVHIEGMEAHYFVKLFATMFVGMAPLIAMSAIIAEEKEKNTLKMLMLSNVKPTEYLVGVGGYVWIICMIGAVVFGILGEYQGWEMVQFLAVMAAGIITAMLIGAAIGTWSRNQMMATSLTVPVMLVFSFLPMIAMFNQDIGKAAMFTYSQQVGNLMNRIGGDMEAGKSAAIIAGNILAASGMFGAAYRRSGLA